MKVTADAAAAVIAEPESPPVLAEENSGPAECAEVTETAVVAKDLEENAEAMPDSAQQEPMPREPTGELFAPGACTEIADAAEKAGASAPPLDAQPVPKEPSAREVAASDQMSEAAEKHGVMWARVKGFPHWPAQVMKGKPAEIRMEGVHRPSPTSLPVMFFGTLEIAWISPSETSRWQDGIKAKFHTKPKGRKAFDNALQQAVDYAVSRKWPQNWWSRRPSQPKPPGDPAAEADRKRDADEAASPDGAKRPAKAAKKEEAAGSGELRDLIGAEDIASAPKRKSAAGRRAEPEPKPPPYQQLRCNMWVCKTRPKRMPKDEIPVCNCRLEVPRSPLQPRPSSAGPPLSPTKRQSVLALAAADLACNRLLRPDSAPAAVPASLPLPQIASCAASHAAVPGPVPQPNVAVDLATSAAPAAPEPAPEADAAQLLAIEQLPAEEQLPPEQQLPLPAEPSSPTRASAALPEAPPSPAPNGGFTMAPAAIEPEAAAPVVPAQPVPTQSSAVALRTGCGENCLNRLSYIHCDQRLCPCGLKCGNRPFSMLQLPKMDLFLTENRGWGVKAAAPIPRGAFIVEYAGEVVDDAESKRRMAEAKSSGDHNFYMMEMGPGLIIDARTKGTLARFINSSCAPNCEAQKWHDAATGEIRVGIFAAQDIDSGVELTYDYMFQHAGTAALAGAYRCMCGAPNCRGTMDTQPERFKDFGKRLDVFWDGDSVFYRGTVTAYSTTTRKHTILYDDNDVERVNLETVRYRWLDESAPMKLSPLREALEAGKTLLGEEMPPLNLDAGPQPELPAIIPPPPDAAEAVAGHDAQPEPEAAPDQDTAMPDVQPEQADAPAEDSMVTIENNAVTVTVLQEAAPDLAVTPALTADVPSPQAAIESAAAAIEVPVLASNSLQRGSARGRAKARGRAARGKSAGKGRKRKAETDLEAEFAQAPDALKAETPAPLEEEQEMQMPKHKMWLKRCQRESQEQDSPPCPDPLTAPHTGTPADLARSSSQPSAELPAASLELSANAAPFTHVSARASAEPLPPDTEAAVEPAQFTHVSPQLPAQLPPPHASRLSEPAQFTQIPAQRAARPVIDSMEAPEPPAQFTHVSAQRPADSLGPPLQPVRPSQVIHPHPAQLTPAGMSVLAHPPKFTHLSALSRPMPDDMQQPAWLAPELRTGSAFPASQQGAWERVAHSPRQPEQPFGRTDHLMQTMQTDVQSLAEQSLSSLRSGMPARHPAADVSGASSAGELDRAAPFKQQLRASRKQAQGVGQQLNAMLGPQAPEQPRVIWPEPDQAAPPAGSPSVRPADRELTPDRMLQPWQSLSAKPAVAQAQPRRSSLGHGRKDMLNGSLQAFHQLHREPPPHQGAPGLGGLQTGLGSAVMPGGLLLPQAAPLLPQAAPLLPQNFPQSPAGLSMHMAMYNMLLLQNPQLRAQIPALASPLGSLASLPRPGGNWMLPQAPPALPFAPPIQALPSQVLPQWPKLDINLASGLQPPAPPQQPLSFPQGMQAPFMSGLPAPGPPPALATLEAALAAECAAGARPPSQSPPSSALPMPKRADPQQAEDMRNEPAGVAPTLSAELADSQQLAEGPSNVPAGEEQGEADMQPSSEAEMLPPVSVSAPQRLLGAADSSAQETGGSHSAGQPGQPENADKASDVSAQPERAKNPADSLRETASQSDLAASVSANILTSSAPPPMTEAAASAPHANDSTHHDTAEASAHAPAGPVGSHASSALGMAPAQDDISRPLGQAEASKLIGIRDNLDQLGAAQPDVPCCSHKGSHAGMPEEAPPERVAVEGGISNGVPQQEPAQQTAAELLSDFSAEQPSRQGVPEGGIPQQGAERHFSFQHAASTDTHHDMHSAAADSISDTPELHVPQQSTLPTESAPHPAALDEQLTAPAAEGSMQAVDHEVLTDGTPADSSAAASKPVGSQSAAGLDQKAAAALPTASIGTSQGNPAADRLPERLALPVSIAEGLGNGLMQQPSTPRLFDPTALLTKAQSPALNGLSAHSSPPRSIDTPAEPSMAMSPGPPGADAELWSFLVDSPSPVPKAKHMAWAAQQPPCFWKQNGTSHAPGE